MSHPILNCYPYSLLRESKLAPDEIDILAVYTIRGEFGNGQIRKVVLGRWYYIIQARVNDMLRLGR